MTTPSSQAGTRPAQSTPAGALRAATDFTEPDGQRSAVPGKLPGGWRRVTELGPEPRRASPRQQRNTAPAAEAPALAARDCPPPTGAAFQAAARQEQATAARPDPPGSTARRTPAQPPW